MLIWKYVCVVLLGGFCVYAETQTEIASSEAQAEQPAVQPFYMPQPSYNTQAPYDVPQYSYTGVPASTTSVTGFGCGLSAVINSLRNEVSDGSTKKSKKKKGFAGDIFGIYNAQFGKIIAGIHGFIGINSSKPRVKVDVPGSDTSASVTTTRIESVSLKSKYKFGLAPRIGYNVFDGFNLYVSCGPVYNAYRLNHISKPKGLTQEKGSKKGKMKPAMFYSIEVERNFMNCFVVLQYRIASKRKVSKIGSTKVSASSSEISAGCGYRF